ncbi:hypothetical protein DSUL_40087 [Desulfovibrionales bacterium]
MILLTLTLYLLFTTTQSLFCLFWLFMEMAMQQPVVVVLEYGFCILVREVDACGFPCASHAIRRGRDSG